VLTTSLKKKKTWSPLPAKGAPNSDAPKHQHGKSHRERESDDRILDPPFESWKKSCFFSFGQILASFFFIFSSSLLSFRKGRSTRLESSLSLSLSFPLYLFRRRCQDACGEAVQQAKVVATAAATEKKEQQEDLSKRPMTSMSTSKPNPTPTSMLVAKS